MSIEIKHEEKDNKRAFFVVDQTGNRLAEMSYTYAAKTVIDIDHTAVDKLLRGQGIAKKLLTSCIEFARKKSLKVKASCTYAHAQLKKQAELHADIVA